MRCWVFAHQTEDCWSGRRWGHVDRVRPEGHFGFAVYHGSLPFELVKDGDLPLRIERMLRLRGLHTVRIT